MSKGNIEGKEIHGSGYVLCLGADLFNEMMNNYGNSLSRKRKKFCSKEERIEKIRNKCSRIDLKGKLSNVSKEELENLVWTIPTVEIAKLYAVSDTAIAKRCKKFGILKPPRGYWSKIRAQEN